MKFVLFLYFVIQLFMICQNINAMETVEFKSINKRHSFKVPLAKEPIVSWMEIQNGIYPNVSTINSQIKVGETLTILIFMDDKSRLYDLQVKDCTAYDDKDYKTSRYHLQFKTRRNSNTIDTWKKVKNDDLTLLHTNFTSFKFPDRQHVYLTCNIEFCYDVCKNK